VSTVGPAIRGMGPYYKIVPHTVAYSAHNNMFFSFLGW